MILLLAGTAEARELSDLMRAEGISVTASLAGATREARRMKERARIGGFGGDEGFRAWLRAHSPHAVVDATHPFAARITARSARIASEENVPYLRLSRPAWEASAGDNWTMISDESAAAELLPNEAVVFLATGRQTLERFSNLSPRRVICRQIDPPDTDFPFAGGEYLVSRPPFSVADEVALFRKLGVTHLIVKNAGGVPSRSKLDAARELGLPVLMIRRPVDPEAPVVETPEQALAWVKAL